MGGMGPSRMVSSTSEASSGSVDGAVSEFECRLRDSCSSACFRRSSTSLAAISALQAALDDVSGGTRGIRRG